MMMYGSHYVPNDVTRSLLRCVLFLLKSIHTLVRFRICGFPQPWAWT